MEIIKTEFKDLFIIKHKSNYDERGVFLETFRDDFFEKNLASKIKFCQDNLVKSNYMVLRGMHYQIEPFGQTKLINVSEGSILDVVIDIRKKSKTYGKHFSIKLNDYDNISLLVPLWFAHGYLTLTPTATVNYKVDNYYSKEYERGIRYDDPNLKIDWGFEYEKFVISEKDKNLDFFNW